MSGRKKKKGEKKSSCRIFHHRQGEKVQWRCFYFVASCLPALGDNWQHERRLGVVATRPTLIGCSCALAGSLCNLTLAIKTSCDAVRRVDASKSSASSCDRLVSLLRRNSLQPQSAMAALFSPPITRFISNR